ncbi:hypothetical protein [Rhodococcus opacus]|uniref:Uncharacterized protein n=1 Tax=Rhodococcus opacus TaxID=37919 RepID=A0A2S8IW72_RHOOP|nr:hypothetical protein [Rhodococcus opacus]PQP19031.1 hypothetical protein C5613_31220 [Rhodococcus opacus]
MSNRTREHRPSLRQVQDCVTEMRRWLATDDNSAVLMAHLRGAPVDPAWLSTYRRLRRDLSRSVGTARRSPGPSPARPSAN